jgi:hypothetical protein
MSDVERLSGPPNLTALYPRALAVPVLRRVPVLGGGGRGLPDRVLEVRDVVCDLDQLSDYTAVCGFDRMDRLPPTYPHITAFPLAMKLMTARDFPLAVLGLVHVANTIVQHRPIAPKEPLTVRVWAEDLERQDRGTQFVVVGEARAGRELVWEERSTYLRRSGGGGGGGRRSGGGEAPAPARAHWRVPDDIGRRYGAVSGDRNPIHLHPLSARLLGMPGAIAHGMWLKARCLAELEAELPDALTVEVAFKLPLVLPAQVAFGTREGGAFEVRDASSGKPHLAGTLSAA